MPTGVTEKGGGLSKKKKIITLSQCEHVLRLAAAKENQNSSSLAASFLPQWTGGGQTDTIFMQQAKHNHVIKST